jgi:hypothetical protein
MFFIKWHHQSLHIRAGKLWIGIYPLPQHWALDFRRLNNESKWSFDSAIGPFTIAIA